MNLVPELENIMKRAALFLGVAALITGPAFAGDPATVNWSNVPTKTIKLFWPGQATYQWLRSPAHKRADMQTKEGQACVACHKGEEEEIGKKLVGGHDLEPMPVEGKNGLINLKFQVNNDSFYT